MCFFFFFCLLGWGGGGGVGEAGENPQPTIWCWGDVEGVCGVCAVDGSASPGLSQTDWTLAGWGCTPVVHEKSWHPG